MITAGILLVLVIAAAWTWKQKKADEPADAEIKIETPGEADDAPEEPVTEVTETPTEAEPTADPSAADEAARQEQEKSTFVMRVNHCYLPHQLNILAWKWAARTGRFV